MGGIVSPTCSVVTTTAAALVGRPSTNSSISRKACANRSIFGDHRSIDAAIEHPLAWRSTAAALSKYALSGRVAGTPTASRSSLSLGSRTKTNAKKTAASSHVRGSNSFVSRYPAS